MPIRKGAIDKYLGRHAEPEARLAPLVLGRYRAVLIVPAHRERAGLLDGFAEAAASAGGRVLVVLVVNVALGQSPAAIAQTRELLRELGASSGPLTLTRREGFDLCVVDRASGGRELPRKQGVGLARKVGADLALALFAAGRVELPYLFSTDADATLPKAYFTMAPPAADGLALVYPFRHVPGGDPAVDAATERYECTLRYHTLGLVHARSPYAYHSVGSALALGCEGYAAVRGFPKRQAGEDFYVLDKLAKLGTVLPLAGEPITIRARLSDRVPFGTGPQVTEMAAGRPALVHHPDCYAALGAVWSGLAAVAQTRATLPLALDDPALSEASYAALEALGFERERKAALDQCKTEAVLLRRLSTWFDALKGLRFIHALDAGPRPEVDLGLALRLAPFTPDFADNGALSAREAACSGPRGVEVSVASRLGPNIG